MLVSTSSTSATRYEHGMIPKIPVYCVVSTRSDTSRPDSVVTSTPRPR
ncbi:Uncharacterised protein [Mycobacteroides abscessus]|nr:Uncharacterised protein [Mycobacteroides abscessus]